jgi:hypothetical protein
MGSVQKLVQPFSYRTPQSGIGETARRLPCVGVARVKIEERL